jgi:hypothetical protein
MKPSVPKDPCLHCGSVKWRWRTGKNPPPPERCSECELKPFEMIVERSLSDTMRLQWMVENHADFCYSSTPAEPVVLGSGKKIQWLTSVGVRVPCKYLYEWHVYDGATWRDALDNAIKAPTCKGRDGECENSRTIREIGNPHPAFDRIRELEALLDELSIRGLAQ